MSYWCHSGTGGKHPHDTSSSISLRYLSQVDCSMAAKAERHSLSHVFFLSLHSFPSMSRLFLFTYPHPSTPITDIGRLLPHIQDTAFATRSYGRYGTLSGRVLLSVVHREAIGGARSPGSKARFCVPLEVGDGTRSCPRSPTCEVCHSPTPPASSALWCFVDMEVPVIDE